MPVVHTPRGPVHWIETSPGKDAPPVVLLHGLGGDAGFWNAEQQTLGTRWRILAVDLRGSGLTPGTALPFSIDELAADVVAVLDEAGIDSAHVVGFSMGGTVAQALAVAVPTRLRSLVLAATFAMVNPQARRFLEAVAAVYRDGVTAKQMFELVLPWLFSSHFLADPRAAPYLEYPEDAPDEQSPEDWFRLLDALLAFDGRSGLAAIRVPTLVICGSEDRLAPAGDAEEIVRGIDGAILKEIAGGHLMNVESPVEFVDALEHFFCAHESAG